MGRHIPARGAGFLAGRRAGLRPAIRLFLLEHLLQSRVVPGARLVAAAHLAGILCPVRKDKVGRSGPPELAGNPGALSRRIPPRGLLQPGRPKGMGRAQRPVARGAVRSALCPRSRGAPARDAGGHVGRLAGSDPHGGRACVSPGPHRHDGVRLVDAQRDGGEDTRGFRPGDDEFPGLSWRGGRSDGDPDGERLLLRLRLRRRPPHPAHRGFPQVLDLPRTRRGLREGRGLACCGARRPRRGLPGTAARHSVHDRRRPRCLQHAADRGYGRR